MTSYLACRYFGTHRKGNRGEAVAGTATVLAFICSRASLFAQLCIASWHLYYTHPRCYLSTILTTITTTLPSKSHFNSN